MNIQPNNPQSIQQPVEIDDMLINIAAIDQEIEHYAALKKHRVASIEREIERLEAYKQQLRTSIQQFMADHGEKTLNYPGVGKVTRKAGARKWEILDEDQLVGFLKENLVPEQLSEVVVQQPKIVKKELNKVLDKLAAGGTLPEDVVKLNAGSESLTISFEKNEELLTEVKNSKAALSAPQGAKSSPSSIDYDGLEI